MKGMAQLWPPLLPSLDVWPASDPQPGLGRKAGGGQWSPHPWVGSTTWASLIGGQPSAWYVGMQGAPSHANVGGFKIDRSRRLWNKCGHPLHPCALGYHWTTDLDFPVANLKKWISSAQSGLMSVISGAFFHVSFFSERSHPYPTMLCTVTTEKSALSQPLVFFPCSPFREPIWGIELIQPAENKIIIKITQRLKEKKKSQVTIHFLI